MKTANIYLLFILIGFSPFSFAQEIDTKALKKHVYFLSSDKMKGRGTGSKELEKAGNYIEKQFKKYNLSPRGTEGYKQPFEAKITRIQVSDSIRKANNIIGFLDNKAKQTIVIGAHYDHLGLGDFGGSKDINHIGTIHNGADDNASGVAGLLELARYYATNNVKEDFNFLFIAFSAEELGLLGSKYWTENPTLPLENIHWMLNMDMIGRYNPERGLSIIGYGTSSAFPAIFEGVTKDIKWYTSNNGNGGSDQTSFYRKNIPVSFFHTDGHPDYHMTTDDADKIDYKSLKSILEIEIQVINRSMKQPVMDFIKTD